MTSRRFDSLFSATAASIAVCATLGVGPVSAQTTSANPGAPGGDGRGAGAFLAEYYADVIVNMTAAMSTWRMAWRQDDVAGTIDAYWENAQVFFPASPPVAGTAALQQFYTELLPDVGEMQTSMVDFDASGRMAFVSGPYYYEVPRAGLTPERSEGTHVTLLTRHGKKWGIRSQIFSTDEPAEYVPAFEQPANPGASSGDGRRDRAFLADYFADVITNTGWTIDGWHVAWAADDVPGAVDAYWPEAQLIFPDRQPIIGETGLAEFYAELLPTVGRMHTSMLDFDASARMAFLTGPFFYEILKDGASPERVEGTHMTIFVRKGRNWKIRSQIFRTETR